MRKGDVVGKGKGMRLLHKPKKEKTIKWKEGIVFVYDENGVIYSAHKGWLILRDWLLLEEKVFLEKYGFFWQPQGDMKYIIRESLCCLEIF